MRVNLPFCLARCQMRHFVQQHLFFLRNETVLLLPGGMSVTQNFVARFVSWNVMFDRPLPERSGKCKGGWEWHHCNYSISRCTNSHTWKVHAECDIHFDHHGVCELSQVPLKQQLHPSFHSFLQRPMLWHHVTQRGCYKSTSTWSWPTTQELTGTLIVLQLTMRWSIWWGSLL